MSTGAPTKLTRRMRLPVASVSSVNFRVAVPRERRAIRSSPPESMPMRFVTMTNPALPLIEVVPALRSFPGTRLNWSETSSASEST